MSYFSPLYRRQHTIVPGLGTIHSHGVGNCNHTTGLDHYFLPEGAEKPISGCLRFTAFIDENGAVAWRSTPSEKYSAEVVAEMRRITEMLYETRPLEWFSQVSSAIDIELINRLGDDNKLASSVTYLGELLSAPQNPIQHFVSAEEAGQPKGYFREATEAEREERREMWRNRRVQQDKRLAELREKQNGRIDMLRLLRQSLSAWAKEQQKNKSACPMAYLSEALSSQAKAA